MHACPIKYHGSPSSLEVRFAMQAATFDCRPVFDFRQRPKDCRVVKLGTSRKENSRRRRHQKIRLASPRKRSRTDLIAPSESPICPA
eukprot:3245483-Amphidinium_carterae.1